MIPSTHPKMTLQLVRVYKSIVLNMPIQNYQSLHSIDKVNQKLEIKDYLYYILLDICVIYIISFDCDLI